jgi:hypothetical protein
MASVTFTMNPVIDVSAAVPLVLPTHKLRCSRYGLIRAAAASTSPASLPGLARA